MNNITMLGWEDALFLTSHMASVKYRGIDHLQEVPALYEKIIYGRG